MIVVGFAFAALAALIHVYIFYLESIAWTSHAARATFGTTESEAETTRPLAFNQGFYNLFLTAWIVLGIVLYAADQTTAGSALILVGAGSMVLAGLVLLLSDRWKTRAALIQLVPPLIAVVVIIIDLLI